MRSATRLYVGLVALIAVGSAGALYAAAPVFPRSLAIDVLLLAVLAMGGEALSILLPQSASGSMAFVPYLAMAVAVPAWPSLVAVAGVRVLADLRARRQPIKIVFNVASHVVMEAAAIGLYIAFGGKGLLGASNVLRLSEMTRSFGFSALAACVVALHINNFLVAGVIAISAKQPIRKVWLENSRGTVGADVLSTPLIFLFAWVYSAFGVIASATLWIPMLGLRQLQRTNLELERTNEELLELMVKSLEARDPYTSGHSRRVHHYSTIIARALGLPDRQIEQVGRAALLHDVGKIHEKYAVVLSKTEKLTPEEWSLIQEHPVDGANLVATMTKLRDVVPAIRHHHENWDGTGYPNGLAGELIPLSSRIIRFADTIDAMTTQRPYRAPLTEAQVRAEIVRCRGTQFDPMITDKLLSSPLWFTIFAPSTPQQAEPGVRVLTPVFRRREAEAKVTREA